MLLSESSRAAVLAASGSLGILGLRAARSHESGRRTIEIKDAAIAGPLVTDDYLLVLGDKSHLKAFSRACPHLGCQIELSRDRSCFQCPCHGSGFDFDGRRTRGPATSDLLSVQVVRQGDGWRIG